MYAGEGLFCTLALYWVRRVLICFDLLLNDGHFVESAKEEPHMVKRCLPYSCALDADGVKDLRADLRPKKMFSGVTCSTAWCYGDLVERSACNFVLVFSLVSGKISEIRRTCVRFCEQWRFGMPTSHTVRHVIPAVWSTCEL